MSQEIETPPRPSFAEALPLWLKIGLMSFGGPAAQIALLQDELVERRRWVDTRSFLTALNFCMLLPGPEAQQLATYLGLKLHGFRGALAAGGLFVLPGALLMFVLAWIAAAGGDVPAIHAVFEGFLPIVVALVAHAVWRIGRRVLTAPVAIAVALAAFVGMAVLHLAFPWIVLAALAAGVLADRFGIRLAPAGHGAAPDPAGAEPLRLWPTLGRIAACVIGYLVLLAAPIGLVVLVFGRQPFWDVGSFFTEAAFVTFGGAYAVLPFVAQAAVQHYRWLSDAQMIHGLALAETTPGPLILVTQYVGFFAGWNAALGGAAGGLSPLAAAAVAAALTTWVTFLPCFLFVLAGAPLVERLTHSRLAQGALSGVTAAVVGVIATLGVTVGRHALFPQGRLDPIWLLVAAAAFLASVRFKVSAPWLVAAGALIGLIRWKLA